MPAKNLGADAAAIQEDAAAIQYVVCKLPSGRKVVMSVEKCKEAGGTASATSDRDQTAATPGETNELFICRTPGGDHYVATYDECRQDGGTVIGKVNGDAE